MADKPPISALLRDRIADRMTALGLSATDLVKTTGLTGPGIAPIRRGEIRKYQVRLTRPLCNALGWTPDSIERLLAGEEPLPAGQSVTEPTNADLAAKLDEILGLLKKAGTRSRRLSGDNTPVEMPRPALRER